MTSGLHVVEHGSDAAGPLVVVVHGTMDRSASFAATMRHLEGLHAVAFDRRGFGRSAALAPHDDVARHVDDLLDVVAERGRNEAVVAGHSFGGHVALAAACRVPEVVRAAVVWEAPLAWLDWWPDDTAGGAAVRAGRDGDPAAAAEAFLRRMLGDAGWDRLPVRTRATRRAEGVALLADMRAIRERGAPYELAEIPVPVVVGHGSRSAPHHVRSAREMAATIPNAELVVVDGAQHGSHASHPAEFAALVRRAVALAGVSSPAPPC